MKSIFKLRFELVEPLIITSPESDRNLLIHLMIQRNGVNIPVIPSTSIKGALRRRAEILAKGSLGDLPSTIADAVRAHRELPDLGIVHVDPDELRKLEGFERENREREVAKNCIICILFGSTTFASSLKLSSAVPDGEFDFVRLTSLSINRERRTRKEQMLFSTIAVAPTAIFSMYVVLKKPGFVNEETWEWAEKLWNKGILGYWRKIGIRIGRRKSSGFGLTKLVDIIPIKID